MASETYVNLERLREDRWATTYRALRSVDQRPILLEVIRPEHCGAEESRLLSNELELGKQLEGVSVLKPLGLSTFEGRPALELEDSPGTPLERLIGEPMPVGAFLDLGLRLTMVVSDLHGRRVVHGDLHPGHILWDRETGKVELCGLERARRMTREQDAPPRLSQIEGSLPYMAPEQAGRLNRAIDARSDLYSLGVVFFQLLTGRLPFQADDASGWVYSHVAKRPPSQHELSVSVPSVLSSVVLKLLEKAPDERYQSAAGLLRDLRRCQAAWREAGQIAAFALGRGDVSEQFTIPRTLYGRAGEQALLVELFDGVASGDRATLVLVAGAPGIGKSSLIHQLRAPSAARAGRFIAGKFDQYKREVPYAAVSAAFGELVLDILAEDAEQIETWRQRIGAALGKNASLVCELIPQLSLILGAQPQAPELPPAQAEQRIRLVLSRFVGAFPSAEHPLTIVLDDLQWVDAASMRLLVDLLDDPALRYLLLVGAYRDSEVDQHHPLRRALAELESIRPAVHQLTLGPLPAADADQLVADAVRAPRDEAAALARAIRDKTGSNPFFVVQLLSELYRQDLIRFDAAAGRFRWDLAAVGAQPCADNVVDLIAGKLRGLPAELQETLRVAACLGWDVDCDALALVLERDPGAMLSSAVDEGLLLRLDGSYRFPHDRVQEAAYSLTPESERPALHRRAGHKLLAGTHADALGDRIFEIVNQLHQGVALVTSRAEREQLAELNLTAGRRAQASASYVSARSYFAAGSALLSEDSWERRYQLAFALELGLATCELASGKLAAAEARLARLARHARGTLDQGTVVSAQANLALMQNRLADASAMLLSFLRRFDIDWSASPTESDLREEYERFRQRLGERSVESLLELPELSDPSVEMTLNLLDQLYTATGLAGNNLRVLSTCRMASLSLQHGLCDASALAFVMFASTLVSSFGDSAAGYLFAQVAVSLLERRRQLRFRGRVLVSAGGFVYPWVQSLRASVALLRSGFDAALENGDPISAFCAIGLTIPVRLLSGDPLEELDRDFERAVGFARKAKLGRFWINWFVGAGRLVRALRGLTPVFPRLDDASSDEPTLEAELEHDAALAYSAVWYWMRKLQVRYLGGDCEAALAAGARIEAMRWPLGSRADVVDYHLYYALALATALSETPAASGPSRRAALAEHARALAVRAADCPANFGSQAALVAAELARVDGDHERAAQGYEQAIGSAREQGFVSMLAVSYETAARFYRSRGFGLIADTYLREARDCFQRWGAHAKVRQLERQHPALVRTRGAAGEALGVRSEQLDLLSVVKASQTLSGVVDHEQVLETLLKLVLEQEGARLARLILVRNPAQEGELCIDAEAAVDDAACLQQPAPRVPASIVQYVRRTESLVLLDDAANDAGRFASDPYFARRRPRSVLCLPVRRHGTMIGILYLENELAPGVFTPDRLLALDLLATQAAVSLENAHLVARERTARQHAERERKRAILLGEATAALSSSPARDGVAAALRQLCARGPAEWAMLDLMEGGTIAQVACTHRDLTKESGVRELAEQYPSWFGAPLRAKSGALPLYLPTVSDAQLRSYCANDQHAKLARKLGLRSLVIVPLQARGTRLGTLSLASGTPHSFQPSDVELAAELGRRMAMAVDNARIAELEKRLRQAQKMEAVGRLAGGIAHDFNNLLSVILSFSDMLLAQLYPDDPVHEDIEQIRRAGERAADLTRQLLAFSRQQVLEPGAVDLNQVVSGAEKMLARLIGAEILLSLLLSPSLWTTWADAAQLEQVVMNLAVNARDAMPGGGTLTIATSNVELDEAYARVHPGVSPGPYVLLEAADTGIGMDREMQARIFEPFFTTKEPGRGTGLGLATVLGIVQQSGGHVWVESELGRGTTFKIYLPRGRAEAQIASAAGRSPASPYGRETVLLVEDDDQVRSAARMILQRHGYTVLDASGPGEALLIGEQHPGSIDLLLSDVVMPRMTGPSLGERICAMRPGIRVLFMSGYVDAPRMLGDRRIAVLRKPFTPETLTRKIREVLAEPSDNPGQSCG